VSDRIQIRMGGYGPPTTTFSRGLKMIGDRLVEEFGDRVAVTYIWNVMDIGYRTDDLWWLVEHGLLTLAYQSSSGLTGRVPELGLVDLPFLFDSEAQARAAIDGAVGDHLTRLMEERINYRILGYFENGFRHISNRLHPIREPADLSGMRIRVLRSRVQERTFELLGAVPVQHNLNDAIRAMTEGAVDAQENPFANTVTYGVHKLHRFHTLSRHFYISRPIFCHRPTFEAWPQDIQQGMLRAVQDAVAHQRDLAVEEEAISMRAILDQGCELGELSDEGRAAFASAVRPVYAEARAQFGDRAIELLESACGRPL
jgi:TRAP-type C4-dicarboxylate transport system substrate-binding protein